MKSGDGEPAMLTQVVAENENVCGILGKNCSTFK
jgi:hypothetical protein